MNRPSNHIDDVERYYARNTEAFLRLGQNDGVPAIHIALWPDGTETVAQAMEVAHRLVLERISRIAPNRIADLGCGMGAGLFYLAKHLPPDVELYGLTLGTPHVNGNTNEHIQIRTGDFHLSDQLLPMCSAAYSIEALAHSHDPAQYFAAAGRLLEPNGRLIILDDVVMHKNQASNSLETYRAHWLAPGVQPLVSIIQWANEAGFILHSSQDLTPWIKLGRPRDQWIRNTRPLWSWLARHSEYAKSLSGGDARQQCLQTGETQFQLLEFVRTGSS